MLALIKTKIKSISVSLALALFAMLTLEIATICLAVGGAGKELTLLYQPSEKSIAVYCGDKLLNGDMPGEVSSVVKSVDGKSAAVMTADGKSNSLYAVTARGIRHVADDAASFALSSNGAHIFWKNAKSELFRMATRGSPVKRIASDVTYFTPSPGGRCVAYVSGGGLFCDVDGRKLYPIASSLKPVSVSDDGNTLYAFDGDKSLYACSYANDPVRLSGDISSTVFFVTRDAKQILFSQSSRSVVCDGSSAVSYIESPGAVFAGASARSADEIRTLNVCDTASFAGSFFKTGADEAGALYAADKNFAVTELSPSVTDAKLDGRSVVFLESDGSLKRFDGETADIAEGVRSFTLSEKGFVYYVTNGSQAHAFKSGKDRELSSMAGDVCAFGDYYYFIGAHGYLFCGRGSRQPDAIASDVEDVFSGRDVVGFASEYNHADSTAIFNISSDGANFVRHDIRAIIL